MTTPIANEGLERLRAEAESADRGEGVSLAGMSREERRKVLAGTTPVNSEGLDALVEKAARAFEAEALIVASEREGDGVCLQPGLDEMEPEMREAFYRCIRAALASSLPLRGL